MKRGDIVWVELPRPASGGREQIGTRPAAVLQREDRFSTLPTTVVVPLTSKKSALRFPGTFVIQPSKANGLPSESVVLAFQVRAIDRSRIRSFVGVLEPPYLEKLAEQVHDLLSG